MRQIRQLFVVFISLGVLWGCCRQCPEGNKEAADPIEPAATLASTPKPKPKSKPKPKPIVPLIQDVETLSMGTEAVLGDKIRIATYNIQNLTDGEDDGYRRTTLITTRQVNNAAKIINDMNADILTIQEIENMAVLKRLNGQLSTPYANLYIAQFSSSSRDEKINVALASRFPLLDVVELEFSAVADAPVRLSRGTVRFMLQLEEGRNLLGYGVHLKSNHGEHEVNVQKRKISAEIIRTDADSVIAANPDVTFEVVVLGDTNVDPDLPKWAEDPSLSPFADWVDLWKGLPIEVRTTIDTRAGDPELAFPPACFDRIIVSPDLQESPWTISQPVAVHAGVDTNNIYVYPGQNDIHVSDHYPVYADIVK